MRYCRFSNFSLWAKFRFNLFETCEHIPGLSELYIAFTKRAILLALKWLEYVVQNYATYITASVNDSPRYLLLEISGSNLLCCSWP